MYSLLDLPEEARHKIYMAAGLVSGETIKLEPKGGNALTRRPPLASLRFTYNVLQTCKTVYEEVKTLICAHNTLVVGHEHVESGLEFLRRLSPQQCSVLTHVFVQLHFEASEGSCARYDALEHRPLSMVMSLNSARLSLWQATARHILTNATPQTLALSLICETGVGHTTTAVLQPLNENPGVLRVCELQLGQQRQDKAISAIACETAARARGLSPGLRERPFPLFDLPVEVRRRILEYTGLVAPHKEVYWSAQQGFRIATAASRCGGDSPDPYLHSRCNGVSCMVSKHYTPPSICLQRRSGYSSRCYCWVSPQSIFTVSHALYRKAVQVLYSCNRIVIVPSKGLRSSLSENDRTERLDVSKFITRHMWPDTLRSLRHLEIVFPAIDPECGATTHDPYYLDLCSAIRQLEAHTDVGQLKVVANMTMASSVLQEDSDWIHRQLLLAGGDQSSVFRVHGHLLGPLIGLHCKGQFFVHVEWAWHWCPPTDVFTDETHAEVDSIEANLEKMIMGNEYDSEAAGRTNELPSTWLFDTWDFLEYERLTGHPADNILSDP
ncbi:hypothetical protein PFICI_12714 [Pestalotiopsis fici W106-1]|uniref:Uncharacterized protein n=1 Tax=Pestalotiopsis fici (strain W106-1 / CGMCC3.15140) TaxID=1229662 RepID=W3WPF5_PESFW|nr:uncharacterized protein PFICI_12714 [Pestalotiopsis fici W106-1]ETS75770.1 hypothetical protein PFICI_12714 [Pestalotiopsis fici W106-1]